MGKLPVNSKAVAAKERKAAHQAEVDARKKAEQEAKEAAEWSVGSKGKSKKELEEEKKQQLKARKEQNAALLEAEEKDIKPKKSTKGPKLDPDNPLMMAKKNVVRGADKVAAKKAQKVEQKAKEIEKFGSGDKKPSIEEFGASNIDDALDLLSTGKLSGGNAATSIERHPERRAKAAYKAFEERMLPELRKENPSLRLTQVKELLWKQWQKSPENPFNQQHIAHDVSKEEEREVLDKLRRETEQRLRLD